MKFNLSKIEMSQSDVRRGIKLPEFLNPALAEFMGVMIGDGHLNFSIGKQKTGGQLVRSDIAISCNKNEEEYIKYIMKLFYSLFGLELKYSIDNRSKAVLLRAHSKEIVQFLNKICEIPLNRKTEIVFISSIIKNANNEVKYGFLRGLADTDFSVTFQNRTNKGHNYPVIKGKFKSIILIQDLERLFKVLEFKYSVCYNLISYDKRFGPTTIHGIYLNGKENFEKWTNTIGFSNPKFIRKVEKWQKDGVCPPGY